MPPLIIKDTPICRTCLSDDYILTCIFNKDVFEQEQAKLCDVVKLCTSVKISEEDGLPGHMCIRCIRELKIAFSFKRLCEKSDATLRDSTASRQYEEVIIKEESACEIIAELQVDPLMKEKSDINHCVEGTLNNFEVTSGPQSCDDIKMDIEETQLVLNNDKTPIERYKKQHICQKCNLNFETLLCYQMHIRHDHESDDCHQEDKSLNMIPSTNDGTGADRNEQNESEITNDHKLTELPAVAKLKQKLQPLKQIFTCSICSRTFQRNRDLIKHGHSHTGERPYKCEVCNNSFRSTSSLTKHKRIHSVSLIRGAGKLVTANGKMTSAVDKPFVCDGYKVRKTRRSLMLANDEPHKCDICSQSFVKLSHFEQHKQTHNCDEISEKESNEKPFQGTDRDGCGENLKFKSISKAEEINSQHSDVPQLKESKPIRPPMKEKSRRRFASTSVLANHISTHTGEHKCTVCGRSFARRGTMIAHLKVHKAKK